MSPVIPPLPVDEAVPRVLDALRARGAAVVVSPPGSGKTTRLPPAVVDAGLAGDGDCWVLEPRRMAARAAARRVAAERGGPVGGWAGYQVRFDRKASRHTRVRFVTDGVLTARLQDDPFLEGTGAVVLDEFHERSLEGDLAVALLNEVRRDARPDLKVLVLSATLDPEPVARFLDAEVVRAGGRPHPVDLVYLDRPDPRPLAERTAAGVRRVWALRPGSCGDVLAFLPGAAAIRATAHRLEGWARQRGVDVRPLHGDLPARRQDAALVPGTRPRVVLSTNVAETSVTVEGVAAVVDSGLVRVLRHDPSSGVDRLGTEPVSRAAADQRAGRAGRTGPGVALRLWTRHDDRGRAERAEPEICRADLAPAVLEILAWGHPDPAGFPWFEAPDPDRLAAAVDLLRRLGAVDPRGALTPDGRALRGLPLSPRAGRLVLEAARLGLAREGARMAALLAERDLWAPGRAFGPDRAHLPTADSDLLLRVELLEEAAGCGFDPDRLQGLGVDPGAARAAWRAAGQIERLARKLDTGRRTRPSSGREDALLRLALAAYPDRVARRRAGGGNRFVLADGRGAVLARESAVRHAQFLVALRLEAGRRGERAEAVIRWAGRVDPAWLSGLETRTRTELDPGTGRVAAWEEQRYGGLVVARRPRRPDPDAARRLLVAAAAADPETALAPGREVQGLLDRCRFLARVLPGCGVPAWDAGDWEAVLHRLAAGAASLGELRRADLLGAVRAHLGRSLRLLDQEAPDRIRVPSGSRIRVSYPAGGPPVLAVRIQEVFGWAEGPRVAGGRITVVLHLLGPHGRPLQVTADLESFWENTYPQVRKEMRGRYPKHRWPEDPRAAAPSRRTTKPRR